MLPVCQQDSFHLLARPGLLRYLDRKCIVLPARCCGAGSCSVFPFNTRPLILQPSGLSRSFVRLWHVPLHRLGGERERSRRCFLPLDPEESPRSVWAAINRQTCSRSASTLTHTLTEWREEAMSNRGRHGQKGNTPNSSYTASSSSDRDQLCLFF